MQKKIIALAVAGLVSGAAFAQSNVEIYGSIDMGYTNMSDNKAPAVGSRNGMDSGVNKANRIGFKGTEDLGNGLKASFVYETGLGGDNQGTSGLFNTTDRQSYLALSGNFGTVAAGRQYTPQHLFYGAADPFGNDGIGQIGNTIIKDTRLDNLVAYISPEFSGFTFIAGYTMSYSGDEALENENVAFAGTAAKAAVPATATPATTAAANTATSEGQLVKDADVYALAVKYANGPIFAGLNYHRASTNQTTAAVDGVDIKVWDLMGTYDFGVAKLHASYGNRDVDNISDTDQWMLGVSAPLGNGRLMASYVDRSSDLGATSADIDTWAIGYNYNISKRTYAYVVYASQDQNTTAQAQAKGAGVLNYGAEIATGNSANGGGGYQDGLAIGVSHSF